MTKTALLHIGTPKTGSTSIQNALYQSRESLMPVCYPLWLQMPHHNALRIVYYPHSELVGWMRQTYPTDDRYYRQARDQYRRSFFTELASADRAIVSAEVLSGFSAPEVAQLRADLESVGYGRFHVVLYIRDPADFYLSMTQQYLKGTGGNPSRYLSRTRQVGDESAHAGYRPVSDPATFHYGFRGALETWEAIFPGRVIVRSYSRTKNFDVVADFADVLNERMGVMLPRPRERMNTTLSAESMQVLQDYRRAFWPTSRDATPDTLRLVAFLQRSVNDVLQTKPVLKLEIAEQIRANHRTDAEYVQSRYGLDLDVGDSTPENVAAPRAEPYQVDEIVEHVDRDIVNKLLLRVANSELARTPKPSITRRILRWGNAALPPRWRPRRIVGKLRTALR